MGVDLVYDVIISNCEAHLRAGKDGLAAKQLAKLNISKIPRKFRMPLAALCRRAAHVSLGLRILTSVVRGKGNQPTAQEQAEYAMLLQRCGAIQEALVMLRTIDRQQAPEKSLYQALCHFSYWEFERAVPHLQEYLAQDLQPHQRLIAQINFARALVATQDFRQAEPLLHELIEIAERQAAQRIKGNALELLSQIHLQQREQAKADRVLTKAEEIFPAGKSFERLLLNKGRAILEAQRTQSTEPLRIFREEAKAWPHAQTVRETDLFTLTIDSDEELFEHLYFGTPYVPYRRRIERMLGWNTENSTYKLGRAENELDVVTGKATTGAKLPKGSVIHRIVEVLSRDFYRPVKVGDLYNSLFPGEYFNIFSSPVRVRQAVFRTREWLEANELALRIHANKGNYSLEASEKLSLKVPLHKRSLTINDSLFKDLKTLWPEGTPFKAQSAREKLEVSSSAFQRFLAWAMANQKIDKYGAGSSTVYFVLTPTNRRRAG